MEWANQIPRPIQSPLRLSLNLYLAADIFLLEYQLQITQIYRICTIVVTQFLLIFLFYLTWFLCIILSLILIKCSEIRQSYQKGF
jgi:hypothetical protein